MRRSWLSAIAEDERRRPFYANLPVISEANGFLVELSPLAFTPPMCIRCQIGHCVGEIYSMAPELPAYRILGHVQRLAFIRGAFLVMFTPLKNKHLRRQ